MIDFKAIVAKRFKPILFIGVIILGTALVFTFGGFSFGKEPDDDVFFQDPKPNDDWSLERAEEFFVEYRLERERVRSREIDLLQQMINNPNTTAESKREAEQKLLRLKDTMELELSVENSLVALGYNHAIMFFQNGNANVVVNAEALTREERAKIAEIVSKTAGIERYQVSITEKGN